MQQESGSVTRRETTVSEELAGTRLDRALATLIPDMSRSRIQRLVADGHVLVDGKPASKPSTSVEAGQRVVIEAPVAMDTGAPQPQALELTILHEDEDLVVIDKAAGLVVHAGAGAHQTTLVNGLMHQYGDGLSQCGGEQRPGIVHRLDMGTSGAIAIARNDAAHADLAAQFAARTVEKQYAAITYGCPKDDGGEIDVPLGRDRADRTKISANTDRPRNALTRWELAEDLSRFALMSVFPKTGRTHQVRSHLASIHHPCVGDKKYVGGQWKNVPAGALRNVARRFARPALHAHRLRLDHPRSGDRMEFVAPFPADFEALLAALRRL